MHDLCPQMQLVLTGSGFRSVAAAPKELFSSADLWPAMSFCLYFPPSLFVPPDKQWEAGLSRNDEAQTQASKKEEEEGPQRATEARVGLRALLQRHPGSH